MALLDTVRYHKWVTDLAAGCNANKAWADPATNTVILTVSDDFTLLQARRRQPRELLDVPTAENDVVRLEPVLQERYDLRHVLGPSLATQTLEAGETRVAGLQLLQDRFPLRRTVGGLGSQAEERRQKECDAEPPAAGESAHPLPRTRGPPPAYQDRPLC